mmetsp:Transcript_81544/g.157477  ORF Transcript_81544/g.157477 Transcript_81544/m.157477 type:complete len:119 (-) Transcript_81544:461-817(-)
MALPGEHPTAVAEEADDTLARATSVGCTWKEQAGRSDGADSYQLGDLTRCLVKGSSSKLEEWATSPKTRDGYEFGDFLLKPLTRFGFEKLAAKPGGELQHITRDSAGQECTRVSTEHE